MTRDQFISLFFIALLIFVVREFFLIFTPFVRAIFWSAILAFGFYPLYQRLKDKLASNETLAAILMTVVVFLVVVPPVVLILPAHGRPEGPVPREILSQLLPHWVVFPRSSDAFAPLLELLKREEISYSFLSETGALRFEIQDGEFLVLPFLAKSLH